jgi:hypothetical protein
MPRLLLLALLAASSTASAIVIRHDVDDAKYRIPASDFPALADMPGEGHGVLIAPQWIATAAHAVTWQSEITSVDLAGTPRDVESIIVHPGYRKPSKALIDQVMQSGDATLLRVLLASSDDIALVHLKEPVTDVDPVVMYRGDDEFGRVVRIIGKGATGDGATGFDQHASHRTELRRAYNTISSADGRWFCYGFDEPASALPLEGITGSGDSGGAALIEVDGQWVLAGMPSWAAAQGHAVTMRQGRYGQTSCNVRISHYIDWIEGVLSSHPSTAD